MRRAALLFVLLAACHRSKAPDPHPESAQRADPQADVPVGADARGDAGLPKSIEGSPMIAGRRVDLAIYSPQTLSPDLVAHAQATARKRFPEITVRVAPSPGEPPAALVFAPPVAELPQPTEQVLAHVGRGLDAAAIKAAAASTGVLVLSWQLDDDKARARLRSIESLAGELASDAHGFIWDSTTGELYARAAWQTARLDGWQDDLPVMEKNITIHYYATSGGRHRAVTVGMVKFGLPDLVVDDLPEAQAHPMATVIDAVAQMLVEGASLATGGVLRLDFQSIRHDAARAKLIHANGANAKARGRVVLTPTPREAGDSNNRLLAISFPSYPGATSAEKQGTALLEIVGGEPDEVAAHGDDPELSAATARAQARLPAVADAFRKGLPLGQRITVKAPFDTDSGNTEWMWIDVEEWSSNVVHGSLQNTPSDIQALRIGAKVETKQASIADYLWSNADGSTREGGESVKVLMKRQQRGE